MTIVVEPVASSARVGKVAKSRTAISQQHGDEHGRVRCRVTGGSTKGRRVKDIGKPPRWYQMSFVLRGTVRGEASVAVPLVIRSPSLICFPERT